MRRRATFDTCLTSRFSAELPDSPALAHTSSILAQQHLAAEYERSPGKLRRTTSNLVDAVKRRSTSDSARVAGGRLSLNNSMVDPAAEGGTCTAKDASPATPAGAASSPAALSTATSPAEPAPEPLDMINSEELQQEADQQPAQYTAADLWRALQFYKVDELLALLRMAVEDPDSVSVQSSIIKTVQHKIDMQVTKNAECAAAKQFVQAGFTALLDRVMVGQNIMLAVEAASLLLYMSTRTKLTLSEKGKEPIVCMT